MSKHLTKKPSGLIYYLDGFLLRMTGGLGILPYRLITFLNLGRLDFWSPCSAFFLASNWE